jgi:phosphotransferase family enzyme
MYLTTPPLAQGRTAEIYPWDDGHVLKLFHEWCPPDWVEYEARIAGAIYAAGVPSPGPGEIIEVDGRRGLFYERLNGISMLQDLNARPWMLIKHARSLAELQVQINQHSITGLPSYKARLSYDISNTTHLTDDLRNKVLTQLDLLPDGNNLCHGDYHPGNILLTKKGHIVIDWMTASAGARWADVARTDLLLSIGANSAAKQVSPIIRWAVGIYHRVYLSRYQALFPHTEAEIDRWMPVIAAARLNEGILPEREALIEIVKERL